MGCIEYQKPKSQSAADTYPYPMEKNPNEVPMFARFVECGLALLVSDSFKGLLKYYNIPRRLYWRHSSASMSTLERFHITSSRRRISFKSSTKDSPWHQGRPSMHQREDPSSSLRRLKLSLYSKKVVDNDTWASSGHLLLVQPTGNIKGVSQVEKEDILEGKIDSLMRRLEKMEIKKKEAQDLKAAEVRSTCEECGEYGHVHKDCPEEAKVLDYMRKGHLLNFCYGQGRPQFNASSSIPNSVPLRIQLKDFMDEQAKINKETITKFKAIDKVLENIDSKVTEVGSSNHQVLNMMKMLETQVGQLARRLSANEGKLLGQPQGPETANAIQTRSGKETEDLESSTGARKPKPSAETEEFAKEEVTEIVTEELEFEMLEKDTRIQQLKL
jgi:hypothetical protein